MSKVYPGPDQICMCWFTEDTGTEKHGKWYHRDGIGKIQTWETPQVIEFQQTNCKQKWEMKGEPVDERRLDTYWLNAICRSCSDPISYKLTVIKHEAIREMWILTRYLMILRRYCHFYTW